MRSFTPALFRSQETETIGEDVRWLVRNELSMRDVPIYKEDGEGGEWWVTWKARALLFAHWLARNTTTLYQNKPDGAFSDSRTVEFWLHNIIHNVMCKYVLFPQCINLY